MCSVTPLYPEATIIRGLYSHSHRYNNFLYDEVSRGKQQLLYTAMLQTNAAAWGQALRLAADRRGGAVLIHCAKGKDRTGVLSALLQHAAGDDATGIVDSYAASEALLAAEGPEAQARAAATADAAAAATEAAQAAAASGGRFGGGFQGRESAFDRAQRRAAAAAAAGADAGGSAGAESEAAEGGVDWSALKGSPPEAMEATLGWIRSEHGAIDTYLESLGCGDEWRRTLLQ